MKYMVVSFCVCRTVEFVCEFTGCYFNGEEDMTACCNFAYERSLKPFHNWFIRSIFHVREGELEAFLSCVKIPFSKHSGLSEKKTLLN